jgi:signal transduction histidine kinase
VIVTDPFGGVAEANAAATDLLGAGVRGHLLSDLVDTAVTAILDGSVPRLPVADRVFAPTARTLEVGSSGPLVQIVLVDVTEEEHRAREQRAYAAHLVTLHEDERRRLAQDLHDDPLQTLTYLVRMLEQLTENPALPSDLAVLVRRDGELATEEVDTLRTAIHGLRPPVLHGISIGMRMSGDQVRLSAHCELTIYRVAQEALSNVARHAHATTTWVDLHFGEDIVLTVTDDDCGLPVPSTTSATSGSGLGLIGMRERVSLIGGMLDVHEGSSNGTVVRVTIPSMQPEA